jgi:hypothetical protein
VARLIAPFAFGVAIPLAAFALVYALSGSTGDLWQGVFVVPQRRVAVASRGLPPPEMLWRLIPYAAIVLVSLSGKRQPRAVPWLAAGYLALRSSPRYTAVELHDSVGIQLPDEHRRRTGRGVVLYGRPVRWPPSAERPAVARLRDGVREPGRVPVCGADYFCYTTPLSC